MKRFEELSLVVLDAMIKTLTSDRLVCEMSKHMDLGSKTPNKTLCLSGNEPVDRDKLRTIRHPDGEKIFVFCPQCAGAIVASKKVEEFGLQRTLSKISSVFSEKIRQEEARKEAMRLRAARETVYDELFGGNGKPGVAGQEKTETAIAPA